MDAVPSTLSQSVRAMLDDRGATFVPGHGSIPDEAELRDYVTLLDHLEATARKAFEAGPSGLTSTLIHVPSVTVNSTAVKGWPVSVTSQVPSWAVAAVTNNNKANGVSFMLIIGFSRVSLRVLSAL